MHRQNRNGHTTVIHYNGYEIQIRRRVRNDSDKSYSVIVVLPTANLVKKRFSNITTYQKELESIAKAKKWVDENPVKQIT